jgi:hypothetical protein
VSKSSVTHVRAKGLKIKNEPVPKGPLYHVILNHDEVKLRRPFILENEPSHILPSLAHADQPSPIELFTSRFLTLPRYSDLTSNPHLSTINGLDGIRVAFPYYVSIGSRMLAEKILRRSPIGKLAH